MREPEPPLPLLPGDPPFLPPWPGHLSPAKGCWRGAGVPSASYEPLGGHGWTQSSGGRGGRGHMGDMPAFHPNRPTQPPTRSSIQTLPSLPVQSRTSPCLFMVLTYPSIKGSETTFPGSPLHALVLSPARSGSLQVSLPSAAEMPQGWATEARHAPCLNSHQCETPLPPHPRFSSAHSMFSPSPASTLKVAFFPNRSSREITLRRGCTSSFSSHRGWGRGD